MKYRCWICLWVIVALAQPGYGQSYEAEFQVRKNLLIDQLCRVTFPFGNRPDPEKHQWPKAIARFVRYGNADSAGNLRVRRFAPRSPFHFTLVGGTRIVAMFPQADSMVKYRNLILSNVFARNDSYNAFTGEGTENHINMDRTSGYLFAQYALGNPAINQARAQAALTDMKAWVMAHSKRTFLNGTGEWNSSVYETYNLIGWLNLYDFAVDNDVKLAARAMLDYYALEIALHYTNGVTGGAEMRGPALTSNASSSDYLAWLWFGDSPKDATQSSFWSGSEYSQSIHAATSSYRPPFYLRELALKRQTTPQYFNYCKNEYLQGLSPAYSSQSYIQQHFYTTADFTLGSAEVPYGGFANGDFQIVPWKLTGRAATGNNTAQVITGNGKFFDVYNGKWRSPFTQIAQHKNIMIVLSKVPLDTGAIMASVRPLIAQWQQNWQRDFALRFLGDSKGNPVQATGTRNLVNPNGTYISYPSSPAATIRRGGVLYLQFDRMYVAIRSIAQDSVSSPAGETSGRSKVEDVAPLGQLCGQIIEAAEVSLYPTLNDFVTAMRRTRLNKARLSLNRIAYRNLDQDSIDVEFKSIGSFTEPFYDWGYGVTTAQTNATPAAWVQPSWPSGEGHGKLAVIKVNGVENRTTCIFCGPNVSVSAGTYVIGQVPTTYSIDYTGTVPVFNDLTAVKALATFSSTEPFIAPNPGSGLFQLFASASLGKVTNVSLLTLEGRKIAAGFAEPISTGASLDLNGQKPGVYLLSFQWGARSYSLRLIIE